MNGSHNVSTIKSTLFVVSKNEWDTKEGTQAELTSNSKKNSSLV